jgi:hypothetical protein
MENDMTNETKEEIYCYRIGAFLRGVYDARYPLLIILIAVAVAWFNGVK